MRLNSTVPEKLSRNSERFKRYLYGRSNLILGVYFAFHSNLCHQHRAMGPHHGRRRDFRRDPDRRTQSC